MSNIIHVPSLECFKNLEEASCDAVICTREVPANVLKYTENIARTQKINHYFETVEYDDLKKLLDDELPDDGPEKEWLINDMMEQALEFVVFSDRSWLMFSLMCVGHDHTHQTETAAEIFHQDDNVQSICTYGKIGTEWVDSEDAISIVGIDEYQVKASGCIHQLQNAEVILFDNWEVKKKTLIHRAPAMKEDEYRFLYMLT